MSPFVVLAQSEGFDIRTLRFPESDLPFNNQQIVSVMTVVAVLLVTAAAIWLIYQQRKAARHRLERTRDHLGEMAEELNLGQEEMNLLRAIAASERPLDLLEVMQSKPLFERKVRQFREANPRNPAARKVGPLRQRLGYGFGNNRNPFVDTRMLAPGLKLQCRISTPKRQVSFLTALVAAGEDTFWIRPPTAKGKPVSLERLPELGFRVTRENDAEYEFTCRVVGQAPDGMRAVALAHTDQIHRMFFRNAPRIPLDLPAAFYVVRQEFSQEKSAAALKVRDSQFLVEGRVKDLSSGGALAMVPHAQQAPEAGDMLIFKLAPAQIKDDIVAEVLRLVPRDDGNLQLHLQFAGLKELDRLKLNKYLTNLTQQGVAPVESGPRPS